MKIIINRMFFFSLIGVFFVLQGCAPQVYNVSEPVTSKYKYSHSQSDKYKGITLVDKRRSSNLEFSKGTLPAKLTINKSPLDPIKFLKVNIEKELNSKGISVSLAGSNGIKIDILKFDMENQRTSGFTPFNTFTLFAADINQRGKKSRITSYIHRGKVPVWSFDEIITPTLSEPLGIVIKEISAKINRALYGKKISDEKVKIISERILTSEINKQSYLDVYELGFGNNLKAIDILVKLTKHKGNYIRMAAISSIGILKDVSQLDYLESIFNTSKFWQDRAASIKAIGDIGTERSIKFLQQANKNLDDTSKENKWIKNVIKLYLM